jgi:rod shape-determining protein MreC
MTTTIRRRSAARRRIVLGAFVVAAIVLISIDFNSGSKGSPLRKVMLEIINPIESAIGTVTRPVGRFVSGIVSGGDLRRENEVLREQIEELTKNQVNQRRLESENRELRRLTNLPAATEYESVTARIIGVPVTNSDWSVVAAAGRNQGVRDGNPVVSGEGLVGRVTDATAVESKVILLTDPQMSVGVRTLQRRDGTGGGVVGAVSGQASRVLDFELVDAEADIRVGDVVVTSGFQGSRFPAGIPVGRVVKAERKSDGLEFDAQVEPFVDATRRDFVSVLLWKP